MLYGSTLTVNLLLFLIVFPYATNFVYAQNQNKIAVAAGVFYPSLTISPILAAAAMSLSSISVVTNSLTIKNYKF